MIEFPSEPELLFQGEDSINSDYLSDYMKDAEAAWNGPEFSGTAKTCNWSGYWDTSDIGGITITQQGNSIVAKDRVGVAVFNTTASGNRLKGRFEYAIQGLGIYEVVMSNDGKSFRGLRYQDGLDKPVEWTGKKMK